MERPWLKHYPPGVRPHLEYPEVPAYHFVFEQIGRYPDRPALIFMGKVVRYRELGQYVDRFAAGLVRRLGLQKGDRVGIMLPNCPQNVIATLGIQRAGGIPVQFNPLYTPREIGYQLLDSGSRAMITLDLLLPRVQEAGVPVAAISASIADFLPFPLNRLYAIKNRPPRLPAGSSTPFRELLETDPTGFRPAAMDPREDPAVLLYTGGTTGVSKGVVITHFNFVANVLQIKEWLQRPPDAHDRVLVVLPMFHSYGFTAALGYALASGGTAILVPKFEPKLVLKLIQKYKATSFPEVPTVYTALLQDPEVEKYDLRAVEICLSAAAPMPVDLMQRFEAMTGATIIEGYGMTETSPGTHTNPLGGRRIPGSVGLPYPDTDVRIVDLVTGDDLPPGQEGEVLIRGPQVMKGYWQRPEETAAVIRDGWLYTGDIGRMDEDGYLYIVDRKKDMIISGGLNVYPREIDEVLYEHPAVLEACTVGVPDSYWGEAVKAFVVLKPDATATPEELQAWCKERLAAYKRPRAIEIVDALPKSAVGKILRRVLAQQEKERLQREQAEQVAGSRQS